MITKHTVRIVGHMSASDRVQRQEVYLDGELDTNIIAATVFTGIDDVPVVHLALVADVEIDGEFPTVTTTHVPHVRIPKDLWDTTSAMAMAAWNCHNHPAHDRDGEYFLRDFAKSTTAFQAYLERHDKSLRAPHALREDSEQ